VLLFESVGFDTKLSRERKGAWGTGKPSFVGSASEELAPNGARRGPVPGPFCGARRPLRSLPVAARNGMSHTPKEKNMKGISALLACSAFAAVLTAQQITPPKTHLKIGDEAPDFALPEAESGKPVKLSDFRGKKVVVVAFFPAAFTGG
jgi:hypothetical protein